MHGMKYVLQKELVRVFSDKKLVFSIFILPALIMVIIYAIMGSAMKGMLNDIEQNTSTVYVVNAPEDFVDFIENGDLGFEAEYTYGSEKLGNEEPGDKELGDGELGNKGLGDKELEDEDALSEYKEQVRNGELDLIICFPENFTQMVAGYLEGTGKESIPEIKTYYNPSEDYSSEARTRFGNVLESYRQMLLKDRVGDMDKLTVFYTDLDAESSMIQKEGASSAKMLSMMLPYFIVFLLFTGPMSLGIDSITGEKERGTMASMLVTPVRRSDIVTGKMIAVSILSLISSLIYALSLIVSIPLLYGNMDEISEAADLSEVSGLAMNFGWVQVFQLIAIMLVLVYLYVNMVSLVAVLSRNAKEAQSLVMPIYILVMVAGVFTIYGGNVEPGFGQYAIPVYGSAIGIQQLIIGELEWSELFLNLGVSLIISAVLSFAISKAFNNERIMYNA